MRVLSTSALAACLSFSAALAVGQISAPHPPNPGSPATAQGPQRPGPPPPARDNASTPTLTGTARVGGRVVAADTGKPLQLAQLWLSAGELRLNRATNTDVDGRYEFTDLPAGRYLITAGKDAYVTLQFGQETASDPTKTLALADGQIADRIDFSLPRGSVITGRITDEYGDPVAHVEVQAMRHQYLPNGRRLVPAETGQTVLTPAVTDDRGQYRIFGLAPGEYLVGATPRQQMVVTAGPPAGNVGSSSEYPTTYFPGTISAADAQTVILGSGQDAAAYFSLVPGRMFRVSGHVVDSRGRPVDRAMLLLRTTRGIAMTNPRGQTQTDGSFTFSNVPPGEHSIDVRPPSRGGNLEEVEFASVPIAIAAQDITGLVIATTRTVTIAGRVMFDGTSPRTASPTPFRVMAVPGNPQQGSPMPLPLVGAAGANGVVGEDGRFRLRVAPVSVLFRPIPPPGWTLRSVTVDNDDITDIPYEIGPMSSSSGVEIVLTDRLTTLSGRVMDSRGQAVKEYVVAIYPRDLKENTVAMRFIQSARPDQEGRYQARGLPPGNYLAVAIGTMLLGRQWDPAFQEQMRPRAKSFSLKEGESATLDLPIETAP